MAVVLVALVWIIVGSAAGLTPNRWHRPIAYALIVAIPFVAWPLAQDQGLLVAVLYVCLCAFQLRLLLIHWLKRLGRRIAAAGKGNSSE